MSAFYNDIDEGDHGSVAWGNAVEDALGSGNPAVYGTYIVFKDGSTYTARDGTDGQIDDTDTDFVDLMNRLIGEMYDTATGTGGTIVLKPGTYDITDTIDMRPGIEVVGECIAGGLAGAAYTMTVNLKCGSNDVTVFSFDYPTPVTAHYFSSLKTFNILGCEWGSGATSTKPLIDIQCNYNMMSDVFIDHLYVSYGKYGIRLYNNHASNKIWNIFIRNGTMPEVNTDAGIYIDSPTDQVIERVRIQDCHFYGNNSSTGNGALYIGGAKTYASIIQGNTFDEENKSAIYMDTAASRWSISNNIVKDADMGGDQTIGGMDFNDVDYIAIIGNVIANTGGDKMKYGIHCDANCTYRTIIGNITRVITGGDGIVGGAGAGLIPADPSLQNVEHALNL